MHRTDAGTLPVRTVKDRQNAHDRPRRRTVALTLQRANAGRTERAAEHQPVNRKKTLRRLSRARADGERAGLTRALARWSVPAAFLEYNGASRQRISIIFLDSVFVHNGTFREIVGGVNASDTDQRIDYDATHHPDRR